MNRREAEEIIGMLAWAQSSWHETARLVIPLEFGWVRKHGRDGPLEQSPVIGGENRGGMAVARQDGDSWVPDVVALRALHHHEGFDPRPFYVTPKQRVINLAERLEALGVPTGDPKATGANGRMGIEVATVERLLDIIKENQS